MSGINAKAVRNDPLQFVKIQNNDLCKKAVEQIKLAEEVKITKQKIKEVEEEWQNNLQNWKSKRRISKSNSEDESGSTSSTRRKTKTFSEILNEKAKSGGRIGYNLDKYVADDDDNNSFEDQLELDNSGDSANDFDGTSESSYKTEKSDNARTTNGDLQNEQQSSKNNSCMGDVYVFDMSHIEEFNYNKNVNKTAANCEEDNNNFLNDRTSQNVSSNGDHNVNANSVNNKLRVNNDFETTNKGQQSDDDYDEEVSAATRVSDSNAANTDKVKVEIKDWKVHHQNDNVLQHLLQHENHNMSNGTDSEQQNMPLSDDEDMSGNSHNNSYDAEDDYDEEEMERLRLEQEKNFKAKLSAFEMMSKQQENVNNAKNVRNTNSRSSNKLNNVKLKEDNKRTQNADQLLHSEQQRPQQRALYANSGQQIEDEDREDILNARIKQLRIERQRAQRAQQQQQQQQQQPQQPQPQQMPQINTNVVYQSKNFSQSPPPALSQQKNYDQQYYMPHMDETYAKSSHAPVNQINSTSQSAPNKLLPPSPPRAATYHVSPQYQNIVSPQEHLYVNQSQLMLNQSHPQYYENVESRERYDSPPLRNDYYENHLIYDSTQSKVPPLQPQSQDAYTSPAKQQQLLYYPKPYSVSKSSQQQQTAPPKPVMVSQQQKNQRIPQNQKSVQNNTSSVSNKQTKPLPPTSKPKPQQKGYNQNHWLLQEAELRRQLATIPAGVPSSQSSRSSSNGSASHKTPAAPPKGMLSVSGKKKCSSCGDELGRGCAAMVVESLSLYYHINCFRCSVCNIQLGNGTVGTDVRVRNHKLHCHNCYSNDEAGLKFSRV